VKLAVIILDMAKGYGDASTYEPGLVERIRRLKDRAHEVGVQVIHVHSLRRPTDNVPPPVHMMIGTENLEVLPELAPLAPSDMMIYKRYLSGFFANDLDYTMRCMGIDTILIVGASTDNTVLWTAADAFQLRYKVVVIEDCTQVHRPDPPEVKQYALRIVRNVLKSEVIPLEEAMVRFLTPAAAPA
jgi:nicotinamidase-related amidase